MIAETWARLSVRFLANAVTVPALNTSNAQAAGNAHRAVPEFAVSQAAGACLSEGQVTALQRVYGEHKGADGVVAIYPYSRGSETFWPTFQNTIADAKAAEEARDVKLRAIMFGDPNFSFAAFDVMRDSPKAEAGSR